jgi:hypothetical protein
MMKLMLPSGLGQALGEVGARTQTLPAVSRPEGELVRTWRTLSSHLRAQAQQIVEQEIAATRLAGREAYGYIPHAAKELLARANTYELCAKELAAALGIRG